LQTLLDNTKPYVNNALITKFLIATNIIIFIVLLFEGAGFWQSVNSVQLAWGANFSPATQDGEWWRLASAMFLHFSIIHLALNMWSLWDAGKLVERMYGSVRFACIYILSGLLGNLTSLVSQGNSAISGGASSAIFGIFGALLVYLWINRESILLREFRWLFWGGLGFATATIILGFSIRGIDNSAHIGGFIFGTFFSFILFPVNANKLQSLRNRLLATIILIVAISYLIYAIPAPKYKWGDELYLRKQIDAFLMQDQAINRSWLDIMQASKQDNASFNSLASQIDNNIVAPYEESFEKLSKLPFNPALPSAAKLSSMLQYSQQRKIESKLLVDKLRNQITSTQPE
jgi:rhomboid protease GluP